MPAVGWGQFKEVAAASSPVVAPHRRRCGRWSSGGSCCSGTIGQRWFGESGGSVPKGIRSS
ncbi:hypothetical protein E2562_029807 [Oryza meyeriana var. granulata]|uniref:Uncharacterized protein n=1 Tax=Oryza meyeriana var. granulata TaxID=110450 RepID=A0A6G1CJ91_9ORYZ|nr:hypothetical protein E2562_029807 [Oryza meyeriana var. granulata]